MFQVGELLTTRYPIKNHTEGEEDEFRSSTGDGTSTLLQTASIGLKYPLRSRATSSGTLQSVGSGLFFDELSVKCTAKIGNAYWQSVVQKTRVRRQGRMLESRANKAATMKATGMYRVGKGGEREREWDREGEGRKREEREL